MVGLGEGAEAEAVAQRVQLIVAGRRAGGVVAKGVRVEVQLLRQEPDDLQRNHFAGPEQPAGISQGAQLEREAEAVLGATASGDGRQILGAERVVANEVGLSGRQREQGLKLGVGERAAAGHGEAVPGGVRSVLDAGDPSGAAGLLATDPDRLNWDSVSPFIAGSRPQTSPANGRSASSSPSPP